MLEQPSRTATRMPIAPIQSFRNRRRVRASSEPLKSLDGISRALQKAWSPYTNLFSIPKDVRIKLFSKVWYVNRPVN
jgi:hypothetical protein